MNQIGEPSAPSTGPGRPVGVLLRDQQWPFSSTSFLPCLMATVPKTPLPCHWLKGDPTLRDRVGPSPPREAILGRVGLAKKDGHEISAGFSYLSPPSKVLVSRSWTNA